MAGLGDASQFLRQGEQPQAESEQHVIMSHRMRSFLSLIGVEQRSLSARADAPAMAGASEFKALLSTPGVSGEHGVSPG